jgi:hypothetical protein
MGLYDLFPELDLLGRFCSDGAFQTAMRGAMRKDVFESLPEYTNMSEKVQRMLLLLDLLLQGLWHRDGPLKNSNKF